ncbi:MAG TPA: penicillin-binding transpeptidase domain-containing protein, partial [Negativicutes bacterium]
RNYEESQINRVIAEVRQPGSAFKPFVYTVGLNQGLTANSIIIDEPIHFGDYAPQNYDKKFRGPITLKKALRESINVAAVKMGQQVGMDQVLNLAKSLGITTLLPQDNNLASAIGGLTQGVNLFELTTAYTVFANGGVLSQPISILKVLDGNDQILEESRLVQQSIIRPEIAYIMTDILKSVIEDWDGTGTAANIGRQAAGKTGTTDNYETAWFVGYTPELLVGIYVGNDDRKPVGISGAEVAGLWGKMMSNLLAGTKPTYFTVPPNIVTGIPICTKSGKLATLGCPETEYSAFIRGTEPTAIDDHVRPQPKAAPQPNEQPEVRPRWKLPLPRLPNF